MRDRGYLRQVRLGKIKERKRMSKEMTGYFNPFGIIEAVDEEHKDGYLAKGHNGYLSLGHKKKTNTRKGHASYRHKGAYGKADNYTKHDKKQIEAMEWGEMNEVI